MQCNFENKTLNIMDITYSSAVDGVGFRDVLFVCGCPHHCNGCHNMQTWDEKNGKMTPLSEIYRNLTKSSVTNVTYSGGEPFLQAENLIVLTKEIKKTHDKNFWIYSGYTFEEIIQDESKRQLLMLCDVLVDGLFEKDNTVLNLKFKGSLNQRIINIKKTLEIGEISLLDTDFF